MRGFAAALSALLLVGACDGGSITGSSDSGLVPTDAMAAPNGDGGGTGGDGGGAGGDGGGAGGTDAGVLPCTADTLADAVRITAVTIDGASSQRTITARSGASSVVAWAAADGIHVTPLDAADGRAGADLVVAGTQVFGVAATADDIALLISRAPDYMTFVRIDFAGTELGRADLVGGGDHGVEGTEWFNEFARTGRLVARGDGSYAAYHALHRHWPDGVGHQGDTLRLLDGSGGALGGGWGWGCSHSMDQRLAIGPTGLIPICISDCYPGKGIYFNHNDQQITADPAANCAGGYSTELGGLVPVADGFFLAYQDTGGDAHLGRFGSGGAQVSDRALSVAGSSRLASYEGGMLLGAAAGGGSSLQRLDADGQDVGAPASVDAPLPVQDFESRGDGEVAWAVASGTTLTVVRVRSCD